MCKCLGELKQVYIDGIRNKFKNNIVESSISVDIENCNSVITEKLDFIETLRIKVKGTFLELKKDGTEYAKETNLENLFNIKCCPICGVKYD